MKSPAERGPVGAWAYEARTDADLSVEEVVARLERTGNGVSSATIRGIEGGSKKPSRRLLRALANVYGLPAPGDVAEPGTTGATPEVPGLADLIGSISALVEEIRATRRERADLEERVLALELAARLRGPSPDGEDGEPVVPRMRAG